ncbi:organic solute transporter subunit alpha-like [Glandiceps talaboti]
MAANCTDELDLPYSYELYQDVSNSRLAVYSIAPVLTIFSVVLFFESVHYVRNKIPVKIRRNRHIWILGIFPMFSMTSLLGLMMPRATLLTMFAASVYFSVCIYQFLLLIIDYYGGRNAMIVVMNDLDVKINVPPALCCCRCLPTIRVTRKTQPWLRRAVLQVAMISPAALFISAVLWADGRYLPGDLSVSKPYFWLSLITLLSTCTGMQALAIVYQSSKEALKEYKITSKYLAIQLSMVFSNIQLAVLSLLSWFGVIPCTDVFSSLGQAYHIYNFLVVCEFFALGIFARAFFRSRKMGNLDQVLDPERTADLEVHVDADANGIAENPNTTEKTLTEKAEKISTITHTDEEKATDTCSDEEKQLKNGATIVNSAPGSPKPQSGIDNEGYITRLVTENPNLHFSVTSYV